MKFNIIQEIYAQKHIYSMIKIKINSEIHYLLLIFTVINWYKIYYRRIKLIFISN